MNSKIKVVTKQGENESLVFSINGLTIGSIHKDFFNKGKYAYSIGVHGVGSNLSYPDALEYASDAIERALKEWGLECEFIAK